MMMSSRSIKTARAPLLAWRVVARVGASTQLALVGCQKRDSRKMLTLCAFFTFLSRPSVLILGGGRATTFLARFGICRDLDFVLTLSGGNPDFVAIPGGGLGGRPVARRRGSAQRMKSSRSIETSAQVLVSALP